METKAEWRAWAKAHEGLPPSEKASADASIASNLERLLAILKPVVLATYAPMPKEIDVSLIKTDASCVYPVVPKDKSIRQMKFADRNGQVMTPDCIIVPGLLFDKNGGRMGRGKAYYDVTLAALRKNNPDIPCIGACFDHLCIEKVPMDDWDQRMTHIVTQNRVIAVSNGQVVF